MRKIMSKALKSKRVAVPSESSDGSTDDLILKDDDANTTPSGLLTTEPYDLKYVVEVPQKNNQSCTVLNKLLILLVLLLLLTTIVFIGLYLREYKINKKTYTQYCITPACVEAAAFMKSAMEETVNPCDDFYQYSCGGWLAKNPIPDGKSKWSVDSVLWDANLNTLRAILNNISLHRRPIHSKAVHNTITLYQTCNDLKAIEKLRAQPLITLLKNIGWFFDGNFTIDASKSKKDKLLQLFQNMYTHALMSPYFAADVMIDDKNSSKNVLKFSQNGLGLDLFQYKENRTSATTVAYVNLLSAIGAKLLPDIKPKKIRQMAEDTYLFEKMLSEINVPNEERITIEQTYYLTNISSLQKISTTIDYLKYVQHMFNRTGIKLTEKEPILIDTLNYFKKLDSVIENTEVKVIQNYVMFSVASSYVNLLNEEFIHLSKNLSIARNGVYKEFPRWKTCALQTDKGLGMALGSLFVQKTFAKNSRKEANDLVEAVRAAFLDMLSELKWMDSKTVLAAKAKVKAIIQKIGYPKFILDNKKLDDFYLGLELKNDSYFHNQITLSKFHKMTQLRRLRQDVDQNRWYMSPPTINAYYNPSGNQIVFPAGILQPPFFKAGYPKALNFGSMGSVIGHEITHGFDNNGRLYNAQGNYRSSWWTEASVKQFKEKTKCFINQYSNFKVAGQKIKGNITLGENIADNGGLKASFKAYSKWVRENGDEQLLPGLGKTNNEVFFIAFGQSWCTGELNKRLKSLIETDVHSPFMERVRGSVQNSKDFAEVFNCPVGSPMNPKKKCSIW